MRRIVLLTGVLGIFWAPIHARAACTQIPALYANPQPSPAYWSARGGTNRPFVERDGWIRLGYGGCDPTPAPTFAPLPSDLLVTLILKPDGREAKGRRPEALIFAPGGQCGQSMADACDLALGGEAYPDGDAYCATTLQAKDLEIVAAGKELRLRFPDLALENVLAKAGAMTIAVTQGASAPCNLGTQTCNEWLTSKPSTVRFCVDKFYDDTCPPSAPHVTFDGLIALPEPNDFHRACHAAPELCADSMGPSVEKDLRYTVDHVGNILVPVVWQGIFPVPIPSVTLPLPERQVRGDTVLPDHYKLPNGDKRFMESYTPEGDRLQPTKYGEAPNSLAKVTALMGTTDGYYSVLRLRSRVCEGGSNSGERCRVKGDCPGGKCKWLLPHLGARLTNGVGKLPRSSQEVCEKSPDVSCDAASSCSSGAGRCVGYSLTAEPAPTPSPVTSPSPLPSGSLLTPFLPTDALILDVVEDDVNAPPQWMAAIVKFTSLIAGLPAEAAGKRVVVIARVSDLAPHGQRNAVRPVIGPDGHLQTALRIAQHGTQTRFISDELPSVSVKDEERAAEGTPEDRFLKVYDADKARLVTVALVDPNDRERDPLREHPNGSTTFVSPGGQCVTADGLALLVPSQCRPRGTGDCPRGSACQPARIVVAVDLRTDSNGNGVPDTLEGLRTPETRHEARPDRPQRHT